MTTTRDVPPHASRQLDETFARLNREHLLVIELGHLSHLLVEPDTEWLVPQRGPAQPGVDDLAATLVAAKALPHELTVRVILPKGASPDVPVAEAQAALRSRAAYRASVEWRDAMAVRSMGRRQLLPGLAFALVCLVGAYAAVDAAKEAQKDDSGFFAIGVVVAAVLITVAWVVSWMVIEYRYFDWREAGRKASAYELIAGCTLEVSEQEPA